MAGLFGARRPMLTDIQIPVDAPAQIPVAAAQPQRRGLFGGASALLTPERLMIGGGMLRQLGGVQGALDDTLSMVQQQQMQGIQLQRQRQQDDWMAEQQARQRRGWTSEDEQRQRWQAAIDALPPEQRAEALALGADGYDTYLTNRRQQDNADRSYNLQVAQLGETIRNNNLDYQARAGAQFAMPTLAEARQWTNSYNDDVQSTLRDLGNLRAVIPYASQVVASGGEPTGNFRMSDVALLRAAARAQTGPGVLTESEVFGTLSPSLQQDLTRNRAYLDITQGGISPRDRLALARFVQEGQTNAARDLWRRYNGAEDVLLPRGIDPGRVGIAAPEYVHPDDQAAFDATDNSRLQVGQEYTTPNGRTYRYDGPGRWSYTRRGAYARDTQLSRGGQRQGSPPPQRPANVPADARWDAQRQRWVR